MALTDLSNESFRFILFGGKGGVGKTTMAAATALKLAREKKVLVLTTDPAPSLSDSFAQVIGNKPTPVIGVPNLSAMQIEAKQTMQEFKEQYGGDISDILQESAYLSNDETKAMFNLDIPGLDEVMGLKKITDFMESSDYDVYIIDTAPTGHTLKLLMLSDLLDGWIKFLANMRWKHRAVVRAFGKAKSIEKADAFLFEMKKTLKRVRALLQNPEKTEFVAVTIPEQAAISETEHLIQSLQRMHLPSNHIIINSIIPQEAPGSIGQWDRRREARERTEFHFSDTSTDFRQILDSAQMRRKAQEQHIRSMEQEFHAHNITKVFLQPLEIRGIAGLQKLGTHLFSEAEE